MNREDIKFIMSKKGQEIIAEMNKMSFKKRHKYLFKVDENIRSHISSISALLEAREKAKDKFSKSSEMYFSLLGQEQATGEKIAIYISNRFKSDWNVCDLSAGIGINTIFLAKAVQSVLAVEKDESTLICAQENSKIYKVEDKIKFFNTKAEDFISKKDFKQVDAVFIDPDRNRKDQTKTRSFLNSEPKLLEILPKIFKTTKNVGVKISPAFDWKEVEELKEVLEEDFEVEVISEKSTCKVAMLWFGDLRKNKRSATCFRNDKMYNFFSSDSHEKAGIDKDPKDYMFELDKAMTRARLSDSYAISNNLKKIDLKGKYLSSSKIIDGPGRNLKIMLAKKISLRKLSKELKKLEIDRAEIIAKNYFLKPDQIREKLKLKDGGDYVIHIIEITKKDYLTIISKKI